MNTQKPISTISFNSESFIVKLLSALYEHHRLDYYEYIHHKGEDDEAGKKDHFHIYIEPATRLQTASLRDEFKEIDPSDPSGKPLCCLPFRPSVSYTDWYLYGLHDPQYLKAKQIERKFHYSDDNIKTCDVDYHRFLVRTIDISEFTAIEKLRSFKSAGLSFSDAVNKGVVPIQQISQYEKTWDMIKPSSVFDPVTGELKG